METMNEEKKLLRLSKDLLEEVKLLVRENPDIYASQSHFIRCAIINLVNQKRGRGKNETKK